MSPAGTGLRVVRRPGRDCFYVRGTVRGQAIYESTGTGDRVRAEAYRVRREGELWDRSVFGAQAVVTFAEALNSYLDAHPPSPETARHIGALLAYFGKTPARKIGQAEADEACKAILSADASPATRLRAVITPLRAILRHAAKRRWCDAPVFDTPRVPRVHTAFLRPAEATALVQGAADHLRPLLVFLIGTGARMSEALELDWSRVDLRGARAVIRQKQGNDRHLDLPPVVMAALSALPDREGRVFRPRHHNRRQLGVAYRVNGRIGGGQIKTAWATACRRAGLPGSWAEYIRRDRSGASQRAFRPDHTPHDLRHTWATWHYCVHKDLLRLRDDGGWFTVAMVERYAKLMPNSYRADIIAWLNGGAEAVPAAAEA